MDHKIAKLLILVVNLVMGAPMLALNFTLRQGLLSMFTLKRSAWLITLAWALPSQGAMTIQPDPQTSGGLLAAVAPESVDGGLARFHANGFAAAAVIGRMHAAAPVVSVTE